MSVRFICQGKSAAGNTRLKWLDLAKDSFREKVQKGQNSDGLEHIFETDGEFKII